MRGAQWSAEHDYAPAADAKRYEDWESAYALQLASAEAIRYATEVGIERTQARVTQLAARLRRGLAHDGLRVLDRGPELAALVTVAVAGWEPDAFKRELDASGVNSSLTLREHARFDFDSKDVEWCVRLSPHYYNTEAEVDEVSGIVTSLGRAQVASEHGACMAGASVRGVARDVRHAARAHAGARQAGGRRWRRPSRSSSTRRCG